MAGKGESYVDVYIIRLLMLMIYSIWDNDISRQILDLLIESERI